MYYKRIMPEKHSIPIYHTKLHRPPLARGFMHREALNVLLDQSPDHPLTLVSAPAGYGKSSAVSHWVETRGHPNAWLSLDETDSDVRVFLAYLVAAVRIVVPEACVETAAWLLKEELPPESTLVGCLGNDLQALKSPLVLVLDDYHHISEPAVHSLLNHLFKHPPEPVQLVIITRRDPPLRLGRLRAHNHMIDVRVRALMFTLSETRAFLKEATDRTYSNAAIAHLHQCNEGWVAGLHLAVLALQNHDDANEFLLGFDCDVAGVQDFLLEEALAVHPPGTVDRICNISILNRFCASLCEAVGAPLAEGNEDPFDDRGFISLLLDSGLFCVPLDGRGEWYRYHNLFQELLRKRLQKRLSSEKIASLHLHASAWFEAQGLLDEAIHHAHAGGGSEETGRLLLRHRDEILNGEQWNLLDLSLKRLPAGASKDIPELLMLIAWDLQNQGLNFDAFKLLDRIEELIGKKPPVSEKSMFIHGSINALRAYEYVYKGQGDLAQNCAEQALKELPSKCLSERGFSFMILAMAMRMTGDLEGARRIIHEALADTSVPMGTFQCRLMMTLCFLNWVVVDLASMKMVAKQYLKLSEELELKESSMIARFLLAIAHYQLNELSKAETCLIPIVSIQKVSNQHFFNESMFVMASVYQAKGQTARAREMVDSVCEHMLSSQKMYLLRRAQAFQADLALRQGRIAQALNWAQQREEEPFHSDNIFYKPFLALGRVLVAQDSAEGMKKADSYLTRLETFVTGINNTRFLIEVLALRALLHDKKDEGPAALLALGRAVHLAQPGGIIRLFTDLGPRLVVLLERLDLDAEKHSYVQRIINSYQREVKAEAGVALAQPLTRRELEILGLLA
jgi:LuxR family maltose regulon positive regulatory protein